MGCVSSKLIRKELEREILCNVNSEYLPNHIVLLTSSTYGALKLEKSDSPKSVKKTKESEEEKKTEYEEEETEVINAWELMGDLEEETTAASIRGKNSPKSQKRSPFKRINKAGSPKTVKKSTPGKENMKTEHNVRSYFTPKRVSTDLCTTTRRKSLSPLFDPDMVEAYEKELYQEKEQIKKIISETPISRCPPRGEESVVVYTTTLRGIRNTFEACNTVRSILESHQIKMYERDVSMDSGFKEELRKMMGSGARVPVVFVKGKLIGGAEELTKLEDEGKLGNLLEGIQKKGLGCVCKGCGGIRFVMCCECNGSCKVLKDGSKVSVKCGECNENGLIHCPLCS